MAFQPRRTLQVHGLGILLGGLCAVFACSGQLVMEFFGGADERDTGVDPRHLALLIATSIIALVSVRIWRALRAEARSERDFHRLLKLRLSELPAAGRGLNFFVAVAATTFGMGLIAHTGERSPSTMHDAFAWLVVALVVSVIAAIVVRGIARVLPDSAAAILFFFVRFEPQRPLVSRLRDDLSTATRRECWLPPLFNRPPPLQA